MEPLARRGPGRQKKNPTRGEVRTRTRAALRRFRSRRRSLLTYGTPMSKRRNPPETPEPSKLRRPLADAEAMLDKQLPRGEAIAAGHPRDKAHPDASRARVLH